MIHIVKNKYGVIQSTISFFLVLIEERHFEAIESLL